MQKELRIEETVAPKCIFLEEKLWRLLGRPGWLFKATLGSGIFFLF